MSRRLLPLFPLQLVVFPRTHLLLHIFEDRYKEMVGNAIRDESEFGIVLAGKEGIANAGCSVKVEKVLEMYPDGRMDILTRGERRFEIEGINDEKDYLQGDVTFFDDEDEAAATEEARGEAIQQYRALTQLGAARNHGEPDMSDPQLSFQLAQAVPDLDFLNRFLRRRSEPERLKELTHYLAGYLPKQTAIERMKELAPTNGRGQKPAGL